MTEPNEAGAPDVATSPAPDAAPPARDADASDEGPLRPDSDSRRRILAAVVYVVSVVVFLAVAGPPRLTVHTAFNHYAHLADAWAHGRNDLRSGAPAYAMNNDFALFQGKTFISFPPFPAVLMLPFVKLAGSPENFQDGQFAVWIAGLGPMLLFLVLEKLRRTGRSNRTEADSLLLAFAFAFGTVYFFTAVEGTVWFIAHVVGVAMCGAYLLFAIDAASPFLAGLFLACSWTTRPSTLLLGVVFALEALRVSSKDGDDGDAPLFGRVKSLVKGLDVSAFSKRVAPFAAPLLVSFALASYYNHVRFGDARPFAFGHEHLSVVWQARMEKWGLFGYHYLAKNLGVMLTVLPWFPPHDSPPGTPFLQINEHGLALWFTTPIYLWLVRPQRRSYLFDVVAIGAVLIATQNLLYQNSGWRQFGYRFSNDYALALFVLLALGDRPFRWMFRSAVAWGVVWNLFGAITFDRAGYDKFYWREGSQRILYQDD
ncbi:MAG: hypothetical protein U0169_09290 [Polyangiaceae bacterium]